MNLEKVERRFFRRSAVKKRRRGIPLIWSTWGLSVLASMGILLLRLQGSSVSGWLISEWVALVVFSFLLRYFSIQRTPRTLTAIVGLSILPIIDHLLQRYALGGTGEAQELIWLAIIQYAALLSAATSRSTKDHWVVMLLSSSLMLFGLATSDRKDIGYLAAAYGLLSALWLMDHHWKRLEQNLIQMESVPLWRLRLIALLGLVISLAGIGLMVPTFTLRERLSGFMPTSGGKETTDGVSRSGIGEGEALVAAKDQAFTFGPVESDLFLESTAPSLYDVASDVYGKTPPKKRKYQKAISLSSEIKEAHQETTESKKGSKEFSTIRESRSPQSVAPRGNESNVVFYYIGRTPQHLRMQTYESFDGTTWSHSEPEQSDPSSTPHLATLGSKPWIRLQSFSSRWVHPTPERLALKLIRFRSDRIAAPSLLSHVHIQQVDRPDFFGWTTDGQVAMVDRDHVPSLTVLHELYHLPDLSQLRRESLRSKQAPLVKATHDWQQRYLTIPESVSIADLHLEVRRRVGIWDGSWLSVEKLANSIRSECQHAPEVRVPEDSENSVHFFLEKKAGPDYLFATSVAILLRSQGCPCRIVSGFYAAPENYDMATGQTAVRTKDLHTWLEVYIQGMWVPLEATPSYLKPLEYQTWTAWGLDVLASIWNFLLAHPIQFFATLVSLTIFIYFWRAIANLCATMVCFTMFSGSDRQRLRWTLWLLKVRGSLSGESRPRGWTLHRWLNRSTNSSLHRCSEEERSFFIEAVQRLHYAPTELMNHFALSNSQILRSACRKILFDCVNNHRSPASELPQDVPWELNPSLRSRSI